MCTILLLRDVVDGLPLVMAANRDELYARPTSRPSAFDVGGVRAVGGRDEVAGGSWMVVGDNGMVVAITNQRQYEAPDRSLRSRGLVVLEALASGGVAATRDYLGTLDAREYNPVSYTHLTLPTNREV